MPQAHATVELENGLHLASELDRRLAALSSSVPVGIRWGASCSMALGKLLMLTGHSSAALRRYQSLVPAVSYMNCLHSSHHASYRRGAP